MKKITVVLLLLLANVVCAQNTDKVWSLLLANKRDEARKEFDKAFKKDADTNMELLVLNAMIDQERGRMLYDISFLEKFAKIEGSQNYLYALWYKPFLIGSVSSAGYDDLAFSKIDRMAGMDQYKNDPLVVYNKAIFDRRRYNRDSAKEYIKKLDPITQWQFCGVFENMNESGLNTEYEPELYAMNDKMFNANSNGMLNWYVPAIQQTEGYYIYKNETEYGNGIMYAQTFVESEADREVVLNFGASGPFKIFVNDAEIYANDKVSSTDLNAFHFKFNLKKGVNRLVLKSSTSGGNDYFFAALRDINQKPLPQLKYYNTYRPYIKSTLAEINPAEQKPFFEQFLADKIKANPAKVFYKILLYDVLLNNHRVEEAYDIIEPLIAANPGSSLLNVRLMNYYSQIEEQEKVNEIVKNLDVNDPDYFYCVANKYNENDWLRQANIHEIEKYRDKAKNLISTQHAVLYDYFIALRNQDKELAFKKVEELVSLSHNNESYLIAYANLFTSLRNDKDKTMSLLEDIVAKAESFEAENSLLRHYYSTGKRDQAKKIIMDRIAKYPYYNDMYSDAIIYNNNENNYEESLKYADIALKNFPYSYKMMEHKGRSYNSLKNTKEAEKYFRQSLTYDSGNASLRKTLYDITKVPDEIEQVATKDIYSIIKQRRNSKLHSDYGVNILLDEYIVNVYPEGGRKTKVVYLYEVITEAGIEELKEYSIGESNFNIIKAEIVKPDGSIVPAEQNYDALVFTNLKVNDVIYLEYEINNIGFGRFYKDFNLTYYFNGLYPSQQTVFGIIHPEEVAFDHHVTNGDIPVKTKKINNRKYTYWERKNIPTMPLFESYSFAYNDIANQVRVSSIKKWSDISNWYADLVSKSMKMDNVSIKAYNEIFPQGTQKLSQHDIAYKIYKYIGENITYSSLDFRQSGYVPQKPSKTLTTKLGDCKDMSTLFVAMAERAGLKANLVLVQTNDNGTEALKLPAISFNHCIVKVMLDGKEQFLEMTNNYLPFKALPMSLYKAKALVVSFDKAENEKNGLINISFENAVSNSLITSTVIDIDEQAKRYTSSHMIKGGIKPYFSELFSEKTTDDYRKQEIEKDLNSKLNKVVTFESAKVVENERFSDHMKYETKFTVSEKVQSVGSLKIIEVPFLDKIFTRDIINTEKRNYDIDYTSYESIKDYVTEVVLNIPTDKKFVEIPEGKEITYKGHVYTLKYQLVAPNSLKVTRQVKLSWENVKATEYAEFKKFVEDVIAGEEQVIGYK